MDDGHDTSGGEDQTRRTEIRSGDLQNCGHVCMTATRFWLTLPPSTGQPWTCARSWLRFKASVERHYRTPLWPQSFDVANIWGYTRPNPGGRDCHSELLLWPRVTS